jgi:drug/metabolite transporter (DMT)-like permease
MSINSQAIGYALLSLLFAGCLDVVYKRYALKQRSRGMFLAGTGAVWGLLQFITLKYSGQSIVLDPHTVKFGLTAGVLVTLSNLLLIESLTHLQVSLGSTIYRLNTIGVVILSFLFLGESLEAFKVLGITCGIVAALFLYQRNSDELAPQMLTLFFWIVILASMLRAGFGVVTKAGLSLQASGPTMMVIASACWMVGGFFYALLRERRVKITASKIKYSLLTGVLVYLIVNTLFAALERGDASVVVPIANLSFVVALGISIVLGMERLSARKCTALAFACASITLLTQTS